MILEVAFGTHSYIIWIVLFITAGLTAFYSFRLIMYVFFGNENFKEFNYHPHEAKSYVIVAMSILAGKKMDISYTELSEEQIDALENKEKENN